MLIQDVLLSCCIYSEFFFFPVTGNTAGQVTSLQRDASVSKSESFGKLVCNQFLLSLFPFLSCVKEGGRKTQKGNEEQQVNDLDEPRD